MHRSKRYNEAIKMVDRNRCYSLNEALDLLLKTPKARFDETVEFAFTLGIDPKKSDQMVRGTVVLPNGTGKRVKVLVIAQGDEVKAAQEAGADYVGYKELIDKIAGGWIDFDVIIAAPETMRDLGRLGKILGPKGLMPSPKTGTVTKNVGQAVKEVKAGKIKFKMDKNANLHIPIGKASFSKEALMGNGIAVIDSVLKAKPISAKGQYIKSFTLTSTMCPGIKLDLKEIASLTR